MPTPARTCHPRTTTPIRSGHFVNEFVRLRQSTVNQVTHPPGNVHVMGQEASVLQPGKLDAKAKAKVWSKLDPSLDGVAALIKQGLVKKIVVATGAGMSVSAGASWTRAELCADKLSYKYSYTARGQLTSYHPTDPPPHTHTPLCTQGFLISDRLAGSTTSSRSRGWTRPRTR